MGENEEKDVPMCEVELCAEDSAGFVVSIGERCERHRGHLPSGHDEAVAGCGPMCGDYRPRGGRS